MAVIGYARISSTGQKLDIQKDKLEGYGCTRIFTEKHSGLDQTRPQLKACLEYLREGDTLVITRLDRLARSATHLGAIVEQLQQQRIAFVVFDQQIDTTQAMGRLMFQMLAAFAEFEWSIRKERQAEGLAKARQRGVKLGRRVKLTPELVQAVRHSRAQGATINRLINQYAISKASVYRALGQSSSSKETI